MRVRAFMLGCVLLLTLALAVPAQATIGNAGIPKGWAPPGEAAAIHLYVDQKRVPDYGVLYESTVVAPLRPLAEALGATLEWHGDTRTAVLTRDAYRVQLTLWERRAVANGVIVALTQPPLALEGQPHVPLRFVAESLGYRVLWDGQTHSVHIGPRARPVAGQATVALQLGERGMSLLYDYASPLLLQALYGEGLMTIGQDGRPVPALALGHWVTDDGLTYHFTLRKGIRFHDGTEVTAEDFAFTYNLLIHPDYAGQRKGWGKLATARALDPYTLELTTTEPYGPFLATVPTLPPLPRHLLKDVPVAGLRDAAFWQQPVGAGPFRAPRLDGRTVVLERNPDFWQAAIEPAVGPWLEQLRFAPADFWQVISSRNADVTSAQDPYALEVLLPHPPEGFAAYPWQRHGHGVVTFQHERWPTSIPEVRQALTLAVDWPDLARNLQPLGAKVADGPLPPVHWASAPNLRPVYDVPRAAALLERAGFKQNDKGQWEQNGRPLVIEFHASGGSSLTEAVALSLQRDWKRFGIDTKVILSDFSMLMERFVGPGKFDVFLSGRNVGADPYEWLRSAWHSRNVKLQRDGFNGGSNSARYRSPAFDELIDKAGATIDPAERAELYRKAYAQFTSDAAGIWVYHNSYIDYVRDRIQGVPVVDGFGVISPERWYIAQP